MLRSECLKDSALIACNVYVSTASQKVLKALFGLAQSHESALLVHAFVDHSYNRSSFHWAGVSDSITDVTTLVAQAILDMSVGTSHTIATNSSDHPTVGMVDHIAVMPLSDNHHNKHDALITSATAKRIGASLEDKQNVLYYGGAHPEGYSLAHVRRTQTNFFRTVPTTNHRSNYGTVVVGSPPFFVENYNIRLHGEHPQQARDLMRRLRTKDGGRLQHVEALTLRYGNSYGWEVACNLTHPEQTNVQDVDSVVDDFVREHGVASVQERYRVGTTAAQCKEAWERTSNSTTERRIYDDRVKQEFGHYFEMRSLGADKS